MTMLMVRTHKLSLEVRKLEIGRREVVRWDAGNIAAMRSMWR